MSVRAAALRYASMAFCVFPCGKRSKVPFGPLAPNGFNSASCDPAQIGRWFHERSTLNLGIACGASSLAIIDVDIMGPAHPTLTRDGTDELRELETTYGALPHTPRVLTASGGLHYYFRAPEGIRLKNGPLPNCNGVEIKAAGGYVIAPPSVDELGVFYQHDVGAHLDETPIAALPAWIVRLATEAPRRLGLASSSLDARLSLLGLIFERTGWLGDVLPDGRRLARCPWLHEHSDGRGDGRDTSTILFPRAAGSVIGGFRCSHSHCSHRTWRDVLDLVPTTVKNDATLALRELLNVKGAA